MFTYTSILTGSQLFSFPVTLITFWYQSYANSLKLVGRNLLLHCVLFVYDIYYFFIKSLIKFTSESEPAIFFLGRFF